jgi:hypothetical protein
VTAVKAATIPRRWAPSATGPCVGRASPGCILVDRLCSSIRELCIVSIPQPLTRSSGSGTLESERQALAWCLSGGLSLWQASCSLEELQPCRIEPSALPNLRPLARSKWRRRSAPIYPCCRVASSLLRPTCPFLEMVPPTPAPEPNSVQGPRALLNGPVACWGRARGLMHSSSNYGFGTTTSRGLRAAMQLLRWGRLRKQLRDSECEL